MDPSLELAFGEILRKIDELKARMERCWSASEQRGAAIEFSISDLKQPGTTELVVVDNWGGLFEPAPVPEERVLESAASDSSSPPPEKEQHTLDSHIVADNWDREFEEIPLDSASSDSGDLPVVAVATKYLEGC